MKIIGPNKGQSEIVLDPREAYRRGRVLDAMLRSARPARAFGVMRGAFADFARLDETRAIQIARKLNAP
jgi:hypothetical protein